MYEADWQTIETAPRDGTRILLFWPALKGNHYYSRSAPEIITVGAWQVPDGDNVRKYMPHWCRNGTYSPGDSPTYWMPLPQPPGTSAGSSAGDGR